MKNPRRRTDDGQKISFIPKLSQVFLNTDRCEKSEQGGDGSNRLVLLCLGLLNIAFLIVVVALGISCAKVKQGSLHVSHSAAKQLIDELSFLRSNHSDVIEAEEEAKNALERALKNHTQLKDTIQRQQTINDDYQKQAEELQTEMVNLQANISALEGSCGRCLPKWIFHNSSCYFFSFLEFTTLRQTWPDSRADCIRRGTDLAVIDNKEEQIFVSESIKNMKIGHDFWQDAFWIGLTDAGTEGTWVWINNVTEVEEKYWIDGEPNNMGHHGEDCGATTYSNNIPWKTRFDSSCLLRYRYWICETTSN